MLSLEQIRSYYPEPLMGFERYMLREYLQYKILEILFDSPYSNQLVFMGGTALRIIYGNERFSEDLDFDNFGLTEENFIDISNIIKNKLELEGYFLEIRNVFKGAFHCLLRFPKLLQDYKLTGHTEEKLFISLDSESQHFTFDPQWIILNKFDVFTEIAVMPADILLSQKIFAVFNRPRNKGRDFYDFIWYMKKNISPDLQYLEAKLKQSGKLGKNKQLSIDKLKLLLTDKISTIDFPEAGKDVTPFIKEEFELNAWSVEFFRSLIQTL